MAIDTAAKRSSALDHEDVWSSGLPTPDGSMTQGDRQHLLWTYSGVSVAEAEAEVGDVGVVVGGGVPNRVIQGGTPNRVIRGGTPNRVIRGGGP